MDPVALIDEVVKLGASDLHITNKIPPTVRLHGRLQPLEGHAPMTPESIERLVEALTTPELRQRFAENGELDFSYGAEGLGRFRCNLFRQRGTLALVLRVINTVIPSFEDLGLTPVIRNVCQKKDGLVLVTGPTGSGKSTTLAAMIDWINQNRPEVIITLEDPIEFLHEHKRGIVNQREVGNDTKGYALGLRAALREDPDIILVGEMRDSETIEIALKAAETGHLVFSTLHTRTAASTVDRIIDTFPPHQQPQIRTQLAGSLQAVISQTLVARKDRKGRVAAREILLATPAVRNLVREGKSHQIDSVIETGARHGMQTMAAALDEFLNRGIIDREEIEARKSAKG
jgi:twitching motility protein PilT